MIDKRLKNKLEQLVVDSKAFKVLDGQYTIVYVPMGKYMGIYYINPEDGIYWNKMPRYPRPFTKYVGSWTASEDKRKGNHIFKAWRSTKVSFFIAEIESHIGAMWPFRVNEALLKYLALLTGTKVFEAYYAHTLRFIANFKDVRTSHLSRLGGERRWRLVHLCYRMSWRKALKEMFPKVPPQVINSCPSLGVFLSTRPSKLVHWAKEPAAFKAHVWYLQNRNLLNKVQKEEALEYYRRFISPEYAIDQLIPYFMELIRAKNKNLPIPDGWNYTLVKPEEAKRRHDILVDMIVASEEQDSSQATQIHASNWAKYKIPEGWKPLITKRDFTSEGANQHHCVGSYHISTGSLFCHVEYDGETATLMWTRLPFVSSGNPQLDHKFPQVFYKIEQLFGPCNQQVSEVFREKVLRDLNAMVKDSLRTI